MSICHLLCFSSKPIDDMLRLFANVRIFMRRIEGIERGEREIREREREQRRVDREQRERDRGRSGCLNVIPKLSVILQMQ